MDIISGKVAIVTGASSGIGAGIAESLVINGMKVVGLARREDRLKEMEKQFSGLKGKFYFIKTDLRKEEDILKAFKWIEENLGGIHVLVNNAGISHPRIQSESPTEIWRETYDVNLIAVQICCREALTSMNAHNISDGYIINISSTIAHVSNPYRKLGTYFASKKAVNAIGTALQDELSDTNSKIRVTTICPGVCESEIFGVPQTNLPKVILDHALKPSDIADTVLYLLQLKPHILVSEIIMKSTSYKKISRELFL